MNVNLIEVVRAARLVPDLVRRIKELERKVVTTASDKKMLSSREVMRALDCSNITAYKIMGECGKITIGNKIFVKSDDFWNYVLRNRELSQDEFEAKVREIDRDIKQRKFRSRPKTINN